MKSLIGMRIVSIVIILALYLFFSHYSKSLFLPPLSGIFLELYRIIRNGTFLINMLATLQRITLSFAISFIISLIIGIPAGKNKLVNGLAEIPLSVALLIPSFVWLIILIVLVGIGDLGLIIATCLAVTPVLTMILIEGVKNLDKPLAEVNRVFRVPQPYRLILTEFPQLLPYLTSMVRTGFAIAWKIVVLGEVFGINKGVGYQINLAYNAFSSKRILAWTLGFSAVIYLIDKFILYLPIKKLTRKISLL